MKVGRSMLVTIHSDYDTPKPTNLWHGSTYFSTRNYRVSTATKSMRETTFQQLLFVRFGPFCRRRQNGFPGGVVTRLSTRLNSLFDGGFKFS
jgi:hypothetical protein